MGEKFGVEIFEVDCFVQDLGRMIGPLVKFYRETGYGRALELAIILKDRAVREYFTEEGAYDFAKLGLHSHSITSSLSSLAQLADSDEGLHASGAGKDVLQSWVEFVSRPVRLGGGGYSSKRQSGPG